MFTITLDSAVTLCMCAECCDGGRAERTHSQDVLDDGDFDFRDFERFSNGEQTQHGGNCEQIQHWPSRPPGGDWPGQADNNRSIHYNLEFLLRFCTYTDSEGMSKIDFPCGMTAKGNTVTCQKHKRGKRGGVRNRLRKRKFCPPCYPF